MNPTRATPIMRAAAVADVRLGLRMAFSRASVPDMPFRRGNGDPSTRLRGRARIGPSTATPRNTSRHAEADGHEGGVAAPEEALGDGRTTEAGDDGPDDGAAPAAAGAVDGDVPHGGDGRHPAGPASREERRGDADAEPGEERDDHGRRRQHDAAGGDVDAHGVEHHLQAGGHADAGGEADDGGDEPDDDRLQRTEPSTWRRLAPMARRRAMSRPRWATRIENEL